MNSTAAARPARAFTRSPVFEALARAGYAARGVLYLVIGVLAIRLAEGVHAQPNQQGALRELAGQRFGHAVLVVMAIGLAGYAIWRAAQVLVGSTPEHGRHSTGDRIGAVASGIAYAAFCALTIAVLRQGPAATRGGKTPRSATADVLGWPGGRVLVAVAGLVFIGVACYQAWYGLSRRFLRDSKTGQMGPAVERGFTVLGMVGLTARAVAFALIGVFAVRAAIDYRPREAVGLDGALARLAHHGYGTAALLVVAAGLVAFGLYSLADARYRRI